MGNSESSLPPVLRITLVPVNLTQGLYRSNIHEQISGPISCFFPSEIKQGDKIKIHIATTKTFESFSINLGPNPDINEDCHLHFNPRNTFNPKFTDGFIVLNSRVKGKWQTEEHWRNMPFTRNQTFIIEIAITEQSFIIYVKRSEEESTSPFYSFQHRVDCYQNKYIIIQGDILVSNIEFFDSDKRNEKASDPPSYASLMQVYRKERKVDIYGPHEFL
nr:galectin-6-like [Biomphalaria glabrata]